MTKLVCAMHLLMIVFLTLLSSQSGLRAQEISEPGGDAAAAELALTNPDEYAWRLFLYLNHPAKANTAGIADPTKNFGEVTLPVVWETWALESGNERGPNQKVYTLSEVYHVDGSKPVPWDDLDRSTRKLQLSPNAEALAVLTATTGKLLPQFVPELPLSQEVRTNRAMYEFIRDTSGLYNRANLQALFNQASQQGNRGAIKFPIAAKEIKAEWFPIKEEDKPRYFWRETTDGKIYGLVAFHILTKDLPNWFWADFGHRDCEDQKGACDVEWLHKELDPGYDQEKALTQPRDSTTLNTNGVRNETKGTVWENYILRGTQIDFITSLGEITVLSNPVIENGFQQSSCIICHARATTSAHGGGLSTGEPYLELPKPDLFGTPIKYLQTDFIWSLPSRVR